MASPLKCSDTAYHIQAPDGDASDAVVRNLGTSVEPSRLVANTAESAGNLLPEHVDGSPSIKVDALRAGCNGC